MVKNLKRSTGLAVLLVAAVVSTGIISCSKDDTDNPMGPQINPQAQAVAGSYVTHNRWGGANGQWQGQSMLTVTAKGKVTYGSTDIKNPQFNANVVSWTMADGNGTNASFTVFENSDSDYFWRDKGSVDKRNFMGWIQNPGEGKLDFRGLSM